MSRKTLLKGIKVLMVILFCFWQFIFNKGGPFADEFGVADRLYVGGNTVTPYGGIGRYENKLQRSEEFDNAVWIQGGVWTKTVSATNITAPDGTAIAEALAKDVEGDSPNIYQTYSASIGNNTTFIASIWLKATVAGTVDIGLNAGTGGETSKTVNITTSWQRFYVTHTTTLAVSSIDFWIRNYNQAATGNLHVWGAQLEDVTALSNQGPGVYVKTTSATVFASRGIVSGGDILMPSLKLSGGSITDTTGTVNVGSSNNLSISGNLQVSGTGPHYISQGNVGIGTTAPNYKLHVQGSGYFSSSLTLDQSLGLYGTSNYPISSNNPIYFKADANNNDPVGTIEFNFADGGSSYMTILKGGNVGIGTTGPGAKLDVQGGLRIRNFMVEGRNAGSNTTWPTFQPTTANSYIETGIMPKGTPAGVNNAALYIWNTDYEADQNNWERIGIRAYDTIYNVISEAAGTGSLRPISLGGDGSTSQLYLATNGNVGIGTTGPGTLLHVMKADQGTVIPEDNSYVAFENTANINNIDFIGPRTGRTGFVFGTLNSGGTAAEWLGEIRYYYGGNANANVMSFMAGGTETMYIKGGNVGIGTTNPGAALAVGLDAFKVTSSGVVTAGTWQGSQIADAYVSDTLTASNLVASSGVVESIEITDGTIVDADISATAGIVDTKLATISTAGKVADSALSANVTKLGQTIESAEITDLTIATADIADSQITSAKIAADTITAADIATGAVETTEILDGTILNVDINASAAITTSKLQDSTALTDAMNKRHTQGTDTTLGTMTQNISMGGYKITGLGAPVSGDDATTKQYVDASIAGLSWKEAVLDKDLSTPPASPASGDRYIIAPSGATGAWAGKEKNYTKYNGTIWEFEAPEIGDAAFVEDEVVAYTYNGTNWVAFTGATAYTWGYGLTNTGTTINIDTSETVDLSTSQTLTNKTLSTGTVLPTDYYASTYVNEGQASSITSSMITDLTIATADIADSQITSAKIADGTIASADISDGTIVNADISASAAIAGTKISPDFGSQNIITTGNVGIGTTSPRTKLDTWQGTMTGAANDYEKAQFTMSGGGTVTWAGTGGRLKWTARFIAIPVQRPTTASAGYIDINQPTTDIPAGQVYDGVARSATTDGVLLNSWEGLYAAHTVGGNNTAITYYIVRYTNDFNPPSNWLLVAAINGDNNTAKLGTGVTLKSGGSWTAGTDAQYLTTSTSFAGGDISSGAYNSIQISDDSHSHTDSTVANSLSLTTIPNLTTNGFVKTTGGTGTLTIDTSTFLTSESDPQVGTISTNYVPKWDGSALVTGTIYDTGNIGIGTTNPGGKIEVVGGSSSGNYAAKFYCGTDLAAWVKKK